MCSRSPENLEFEHFALLFSRDGREMYQNDNARAERLFLLANAIVSWRSRCLSCLVPLCQIRAQESVVQPRSYGLRRPGNELVSGETFSNQESTNKN